MRLLVAKAEAQLHASGGPADPAPTGPVSSLSADRGGVVAIETSLNGGTNGPSHVTRTRPRVLTNETERAPTLRVDTPLPRQTSQRRNQRGGGHSLQARPRTAAYVRRGSCVQAAVFNRGTKYRRDRSKTPAAFSHRVTSPEDKRTSASEGVGVRDDEQPVAHSERVGRE